MQQTSSSNYYMYSILYCMLFRTYNTYYTFGEYVRILTNFILDMNVLENYTVSRKTQQNCFGNINSTKLNQSLIVIHQ